MTTYWLNSDDDVVDMDEVTRIDQENSSENTVDEDATDVPEDEDDVDDESDDEPDSELTDKE